MDLYHGMYNNDMMDEDEDGRQVDEQTSLLFEAVRKNQLDEALRLVTDGRVSPNQLSSTSVTPLYIAMDNQNITMVRMLLEHGVDVNKPSYCHTYCTYEMPVVTAARLQNPELLDMILEQGCDMEGSLSFREGKTALQWAASHGNTVMADILIHHRADVNWIGMYFHTALHYATIADKQNMVCWLLDKGAEVNINGDGRTPLHIASVRGNTEIVKCLVDSSSRFQMDTEDNSHCTPLSLACLRGHLNIVKYLMDHKPSDVTYDLPECLRKASESGHVAVVRHLLDSGADVNIPNPAGETALGIAARGQYQTTQVLLEHGANVNAIDNRGYTPLQQALMRDQREISACLIRHGSSLRTHSPLIDSPLQIAFSMSNAVLVKYILQAGCPMSNERWFNTHVVEQKLQELDFQVPALMRFLPQSTVSKRVWFWVRETFGRTRSLAQLSRISIREQLVVSTGGSSILGRIELLPLPSSLKSYIMFTDIFNEY